MLATLVAEPFQTPGWTFEEKYDGDRMLAYKQARFVRLRSRSGEDRTDRFPDVAKAIAELPAQSLVLDGEIAVFDRQGISRFQLLQQGKGRPVYAVFDCLFRDGEDLRTQPLSARRKVLQSVVKAGPSLRLARVLKPNGLEAFRQAKRAGFEGLIAKDLSSPYVPGRSSLWRKVKIHREDEFIILGYTRPEGARKYFGALLLGVYQGGKLRYVGRVGTGFDRATLASLHKRFVSLRADKPPLSELPPGKGNVYLRPRLVAQISYQELTSAGMLRQPVYLGLRNDKSVRDVTLPRPV
jgi:bifunctional non-homologous end joining protein LigD